MQELIWIARPLLLAVLLAVGGRQLPLVACGVLSIAGTVVYTLGLRAAPDVPGTRATATSPLRQARVRVLLACCACYGVSAGILNLALVAFAGAHARKPPGGREGCGSANRWLPSKAGSE